MKEAIQVEQKKINSSYVYADTVIPWLDILT